MYDLAILAFAAIAAVAAVLTVLPLLGFDIRIRGRQTVHLVPIESKQIRKVWLAMALALVSLGLSTGAFYYFFRPRVVEKIVEKTVEKPVSVPCPEPSDGPKQAKPQKKLSQQQSGKDNAQVGSITQGPCSAILVGGSQNQAQGGNCVPADRSISTNQSIALGEGVKGIPLDVRIVIEHPTDSEASDYAKMIHDAIAPYHPVDLGTALSYGGQPPPKGLYVLAYTDDTEVLPFANHLYDLMKKSGISCEAYQVDWVPSGTLRINVGVMPRSQP